MSWNCFQGGFKKQNHYQQKTPTQTQTQTLEKQKKKKEGKSILQWPMLSKNTSITRCWSQKKGLKSASKEKYDGIMQKAFCGKILQRFKVFPWGTKRLIQPCLALPWCTFIMLMRCNSKPGLLNLYFMFRISCRSVLFRAWQHTSISG